ncbi:RNA pseudouridine synthase [Treponema sp.]|uniref:RluA family pseudouridine synthase n=1 Tax=Treponema sp. TaxID=166 RepID=UPI00298DDAB2|nr:RNA pseudouridine synthase [Treponema sp.]MCR5613573.1 RNA pseudouridine synthase [Treponema sp.]
MNTIPIIYENSEIIIINKPQGLAVQGGQNIAHPLDKELPLQLGYPVYLVHRLDQETSGLMIVAKTPAAASKWTRLIGEKSVKKEYDALCIGVPPKNKGQFKSSIIEHGVKKDALTFYEVKKSWTVESYTLSHIHLTLGTGRMHQIRIHLAKAGFPIAGDDKHGAFKANKELKKLCGIKRLKLISSRLTLPLDGRDVTFEVPVDFDIKME